MRMIKRLSCILVCFVTILTLIVNMFVPISSYADGWAIDWFGTELWTDKKNNLQSEDVYYLQVYYNRTYSLMGFSISPSKVEKVSVNENYDKITLTFDNVSRDGYFINNYVYSSGIIVYSGRTSTSQKVLEYTSFKNMSYSSEKVEEEDTSFFGRLWQGLKNMWYSDKDSTIDFWFGDNNVVDYWDNIGNNWCDFVKTILDIDDSDTSTLNAVMTDIYNNDYSRDYWTNVDNKKITQIQNTSNNIKHFWENNVTVVEDNDSYHYEIKNYNPGTNTYPSYLYNEDYFYEYLVYNIDTNNDDVVYWLKRIYSLLVDYFSSFEEDSSCDESSNEEFLKQLKTIIVKKIPLWSQCIEILEPVTNTCIDNLDNDTIDLIEDSHTVLLTEKYSISALNSDSQLDIDTTYDTMLFNNLLIVTTDVGNNVLYLSIPVNQNWIGYEFNRFNIPFLHYYNNFRQKISDLLLFLGWLLFAWSVIHRTSKLFGHNSSNKE